MNRDLNTDRPARGVRSSFTVTASVEVMRKGELQGRMAATNVFERQGGEWKIIHHQAGQISWS